jgi:hypothetical protein
LVNAVETLLEQRARAKPLSKDRETSRLARVGDLVWPLAIALLGLSLRLAYVLDLARHPLGCLPWVDEGAYWTRAGAILNGAWLPSRPFFQDPLYPYLLSRMIRVVGTEVPRLRIAWACLGTLTPLAVYAAGRRGLGRAEGVVGGVLLAVCGPLIFTDGLLEKEGVAALLAATALALTAWSADPAGRAWRLVAPGFAWGTVALLRANALVLAPIGALWWIWVGTTPGSRRRRLTSTALFLLGFALAIAPATVVNALVSEPRELILTTWQGGANFYIGNGPEATGTYSAPDFVEANPAREADDFALEAVRRAGKPLSWSGVSRFWLLEGLRRWREAPGASLRLLAYKFGLLTHDFEIPDNQDIEVIRLVAAPRLSWGFVSLGVLLPLAVLGLGRGERSPFWWFLVLSTGAGLATTALFFVVGRYRIPWIPGLALLAAAGLVDLGRRIGRREWWGVAWRVFMLALPAAALAWRPISDPTPDRWGHAQIELALAYLADGNLEPAIDALDDGRALGEGPAVRIASLLEAGPVHDRLASLVQSRLNPALPRPRGATELDRARWLRQFPETRAESRRLLETLLRSHPGNPAICREWGAWWLGEPTDLETRRQVRNAFALATRPPALDTSAAVLRALLDTDPRPLQNLSLSPSDRAQARARLARAIISWRGR